MENILLKLDKKLKKEKITKKELSKIINVSTATITNYFKGKYRFNFIKFTEIIEYLYIDDREKQQLYLEFCKKTAKDEFLYEAAEWFKNNGDNESLEDLVNIYEQDKFFFKLQREMINMTKQKSKSEELFFKLEEISSRHKLSLEENCLLNITKVYCLSLMSNFSLIEGYVNIINKQLELINNEYIRLSFQSRMLSNLALSKLRKNDLEELRVIANDFLTLEYNKKFKPTYNYFLQILAESYIFDDYEKSKKYINLALAHFKESSIKSKNKEMTLKATHDFIKIKNNDFDNLFLETTGEIIYFYIKTGQLYRAKEVLIKQKRLTSFQLFYKFLVTNNELYKIQSIKSFLENGDSYYLKIVENH